MDGKLEWFATGQGVRSWQRDYRLWSGSSALPRDVSPLRYPGGKGSLKYLLANIVVANGLTGGTLVEPFCGGAGGTLPLVSTGLIGSLHLNDANPAIAAFWHCVFHDTNALAALVSSTPTTVTQWHWWRDVLLNSSDADPLELGFAAFFLNRVNRSGLLYGGPIGGMEQTGNYKMDCRFNRSALIRRIEALSELGGKVHVSNMDAVSFLDRMGEDALAKALVYLDPPYVEQGRNLYKNFAFEDADHRRMAGYIKGKPWRWLITYDDHPSVRSLYSGCAVTKFEFSYLMQQAKQGRELLIASASCRIP